MSIESLLTSKVIEAVKQCYGADVEAGNIQLQATRKEFAGDLTVVVFPFTRFSKKSPEETAKQLGDYLREHMDLPYEKNIKCSNYVGETIDMAIDMGVKGILFIAHIGKFVKVAAGIMNTHSHSADARMEVLASNAIRAGASLECAKEILNASTTDEAIDILEKYQILQKTMKEILDRIQFYLNHRSYEQILLGAVIFNNTYGYLGQTADAEKLIKLINAQNDEAQ